jgi:hypothetical protein
MLTLKFTQQQCRVAIKHEMEYQSTIHDYSVLAIGL